MVCVGTVTPRKGYDVLVGALRRISDLAWSCRFAGSLERDPVYADAVLARVEDAEDGQALVDRLEATHVVKIGVREHEQVDASRPVASKQRKDHVTARIPLPESGSCVKQDPTPVRGAKHGCVALPHVETADEADAAR